MRKGQHTHTHTCMLPHTHKERGRMETDMGTCPGTQLGYRILKGSTKDETKLTETRTKNINSRLKLKHKTYHNLENNIFRQTSLYYTFKNASPEVQNKTQNLTQGP